MRNPTQLDLGPLKRLCRTGSYYLGFVAQWGVPMAEDAGGVLLGLVVIILACVSILAALHVW
jgi:hypothetical protein